MYLYMQTQQYLIFNYALYISQFQCLSVILKNCSLNLKTEV